MKTAFILLTAGVFLAHNAMAADEYPTRQVTLVVAFPPGGSNDLFARRISQDLSDALKQPVIVENRSGAGGIVGALSVANAAPDGHTLILVSSTFVTTAAIQSKPPYDIAKSFAPVALLARGPLIVAVNKDFPANDPKELISAIQKNPGKYNYASSGSGSLSQFSTELLKAQAGNLQIVHVPYRGTGPALIDLIANHTQLCIASAPALMPMVRAGRIRAIGVTSLKPSAVFPDLPTVSSAIPGYEYESWWGVLAPAGTPAAIVSRLNQVLNAIIQIPAIRQSFLTEGAESAPGAPAEFAAVMERDLERVKRIAREQNIVAD